MPDTPHLYGLPLPEAQRRVGALRQLAGVDSFEETQGAARGARRLVITSGGGLTVDVHPDRACDLGAVTYRGVPLAWHSPTGFTSPARAEPTGTGWLRTFGGGLLATCGLDAFGPPSANDTGQYPMHGRVGAIPATITRCAVTDTEIIVEGEVRQAVVFGENLILRRRIRVPIGAASIIVEDEVENASAQEAGHMVLYHANLGWPLLDESAVITIPSRSMTPRDDAAAAGLADWFAIRPPSPLYAEQVFRHDFTGCEDAEVAVDNPEQDLRLAITFDTATLPALHQWKMLADGHYVLGLEPTNIDWSLGRAAAMEAGVLPMLQPGERVTHRVEFTCGPSRIRSTTAPAAVAAAATATTTTAPATTNGGAA